VFPVLLDLCWRGSLYVVLYSVFFSFSQPEDFIIDTKHGFLMKHFNQNIDHRCIVLVTQNDSVLVRI
jgi:hypothetical protein